MRRCGGSPKSTPGPFSGSGDSADIAEGDIDLFTVYPKETLERVRGWIRL